MVKPITPDEVVDTKLNRIFEPKVIEAWNKIIAKNFSGNRSHFKQAEIVEELVSIGFSKDEIFKKGLLDAENIYRKVGWIVSYDKPGYNEDYPATFTFTKPKRYQE